MQLRKRSTQQQHQQQPFCIRCFSLLIVFGLLLLILLYGLAWIQTEDEGKNNDFVIKQLKNENDELKTQIAHLQQQEQQQQQRKQLSDNNDNNNNNPNNNEAEIEKFKTNVQNLREYKIRMHKNIKQISKRIVLEKYGPGPYQIEIHVSYDPKSNIYTATNKGGIIVIELASIDDMPATILLFLEQVTHGLMNGCSFHRNAGHVVQGGPASNFMQTIPKHKDFKDALLESVPFQEYSPNFPHVKYTLGYAGRPGGPDFYISTMDNTRNHGPGGQSNYADPTEADPCFGKVIRGFDIVDQMHQSTVQPGGYKAMEYNIAITQMKLLTPQQVVQ